MRKGAADFCVHDMLVESPSRQAPCSLGSEAFVGTQRQAWCQLLLRLLCAGRQQTRSS